MSLTRITPANVTDFPNGTRVRFFRGCPVSTGASFDGPQEEDGEVIGWAARPASKHFPETAELIVETESGRKHPVSAFTTVGIGAYLIDGEPR